GFCGCVVSLHPATYQCTDGAYGDDGAAAPLILHAVCGRLGHVVGAMQVDGHGAFEGFGWCVQEGVERTDPRVTHEYIDATELLRGRGAEPGRGAALSHVAFHLDDPAAERLHRCHGLVDSLS